ncbi:uncharacterized protein LOC128546417 [Mercenaria mercenaria]|uniref:uncharacterized protein LOC128546417 n=1 Tax=Mercenaria mercenaria TaxID=6596 RepID=UPI00234E7A2D|nr:uncharacterized protein LOC128546417 [Mercenaria mercenaria]
MAGVAAAKTLGEKGCSNALILEGSNRIGGRLKSFNMSGYTVELGAQWIYGLGSNPMVALANEYGLAIAPFASSAVVRDKFGNDVTEEAFKEWYRLRSVMKKAKEFGRKLQRDHKPDITYEALLRKFGWNPVDIAAEAMESYELDIINGKETPSVSGKYSDTLRAFEEHDSYVWMIASDPRGYSYIIEEMVRGFRNGQSILFNKTVTSIINWDDENAPVKVFTEDGSIYEADDVIITVSLGVLQSRKISFNPPLSENKMMAIDKFGFGQNTLVYLKFPTAFWDNVSAIVYASERHGKYNTWFNMNYVYPGCNILQVNANGFEGEAVERMTDAETVEELMGIFRSMYPDANISQPESIVKSDWLTDPLTMGSYCYWTPAFRPEDMDNLGMSEGNLHFAGECISQTNFGFVHSAYTSGVHAAMDLAESVNLEEMFDKDKKK